MPVFVSWLKFYCINEQLCCLLTMRDLFVFVKCVWKIIQALRISLSGSHAVSIIIKASILQQHYPGYVIDEQHNMICCEIKGIAFFSVLIFYFISIFFLAVLLRHTLRRMFGCVILPYDIHVLINSVLSVYNWWCLFEKLAPVHLLYMTIRHFVVHTCKY